MQILDQKSLNSNFYLLHGNIQSETEARSTYSVQTNNDVCFVLKVRLSQNGFMKPKLPKFDKDKKSYCCKRILSLCLFLLQYIFSFWFAHQYLRKYVIHQAMVSLGWSGTNSWQLSRLRFMAAQYTDWLEMSKKSTQPTVLPVPEKLSLGMGTPLD